MAKPMSIQRILGALLACSSALLGNTAFAQRSVDVSTAEELTAAFADALPGDVIELAPGEYNLRHRLNTSVDGEADSPITVRGRSGAVVHFTDATGIVEGFVVAHPYWTFEGLEVVGDCDNHSRCEHAWHIVGAADFTIVRNNVARNFNAQIKGNGTTAPGRPYPDDVLVEGNEFYNDTPRMTSNPVTPIDVVGGRRWILRANYIHDFAKGAGNNISYAAFLKGNSRDGIIECNIVECENLHRGQIRLGLSFGGGGTGMAFCEDEDCSSEHRNGIMRNNVISHCPTDVGIYINRCSGCALLHNTVYDSTGIDVRFDTTENIRIEGNLLGGRIRDRNGASSVRMNNLENVSPAMFQSIYADPDALDFGAGDASAIIDQASTSDVTSDLCGNSRDDGSPDLGAIELDGDGRCQGDRRHRSTSDAGTMPNDAGTTPADAGTVEADAATPSADAGSQDTDAGRPPGADAGAGTEDRGGCDCRTTGNGTAGWLLFATLALLHRRRR